MNERSWYWEWAPARPHVACVWVGHTGTDGAYTDRILPDACIDVIWNGEELYVAGPDTGPVPYRGVIGRTNVGVRFRPGHANAFLGVSAGDIRDQRVDVADLLGVSAADRIADVVSSAPDAARALEAVVTETAEDDGDPLVDAVVAGMRKASGPGAVDALARDLGVHPRSLHRRCVDVFGYGPKTLQRVLRFRRFLSAAESVPDADLATLAVETGYSDQAHLSRDCRELSGLSPTALLAPARAPVRSVQDGEGDQPSH